MIAFHTGLRFKDICHLKSEDVDLNAGTIEIVPAKTSRFRKAVYIHLHKDVIDVLKKATKGNVSDYFFPEAVARYRSGTFGVQFKRILKKANVLDNRHGKAKFPQSAFNLYHKLRRSRNQQNCHSGDRRTRLSAHD